MEEDQSPSIFQQIFDEIKAGNPVVILLILLVMMFFCSLWVWQITHNSVVITPTPRFTHSTVVSPVKMLTARALTAVPTTLTPTAVATPIGVIFDHVKIDGGN